MLARSLTAAFGLLALTSAVTTVALAQDEAAAENPVVAVVNGNEIHMTDVEFVARSLPEQMRQMPLPQLFPMLLDRVIDFQLLSAEAEKQDFAEDEQVQAALDRARASVLCDAMLQQMIDEATTEEALQKRYNEMKEQEGFSYEEVHARHILLASEDEAKEVIEALDGGADFAELAKEKSTGPSGPQGGDLGYFKKDQMVPEFGNAAFGMEIGATSSEPVQTQFGYHVIKVEDNRTVEPTMDETAPQLRQEVAREIVTALVTELREDAEIERFNMDGSPVPEAPAEGEAAPATD
jgi:peptidyl-prolyl cis-trans isomerase C